MAQQKKRLICIGCPLGCPLELVHDGDEVIQVSGEQCKRGKDFAREEFADPRRTFSTTVPIAGALLPRLPVKLSQPIPKARIMAAVREVQALSVEAPIALGEVLLANVLGLDGVNVLACRTMERTHSGGVDASSD